MISIGNSRSVLPPAGELDPRTDLLRQRLGRGAGAVGDQALREAVAE